MTAEYKLVFFLQQQFSLPSPLLPAPLTVLTRQHPNGLTLLKVIQADRASLARLPLVLVPSLWQLPHPPLRQAPCPPFANHRPTLGGEGREGRGEEGGEGRGGEGRGGEGRGGEGRGGEGGEERRGEERRRGGEERRGERRGGRGEERRGEEEEEGRGGGDKVTWGMISHCHAAYRVLHTQMEQQKISTATMTAASRMEPNMMNSLSYNLKPFSETLRYTKLALGKEGGGITSNMMAESLLFRISYLGEKLAMAMSFRYWPNSCGMRVEVLE